MVKDSRLCIDLKVSNNHNIILATYQVDSSLCDQIARVMCNRP